MDAAGGDTRVDTYKWDKDKEVCVAKKCKAGYDLNDDEGKCEDPAPASVPCKTDSVANAAAVAEGNKPDCKATSCNEGYKLENGKCDNCADGYEMKDNTCQKKA